jgi:hypothetical protein
MYEFGNNNKVAENLIEIRKQLDLNQDEFINTLRGDDDSEKKSPYAMGRTTLSRAEGYGDIGNFSVNQLKAICNTIGCDADYLLRGNNCIKAENQRIQDIIGISEESIDSLKKITKKIQSTENPIKEIFIIKLIDFLLSNDENAMKIRDRLIDLLFSIDITIHQHIGLKYYDSICEESKPYIIPPDHLMAKEFDAMNLIMWSIYQTNDDVWIGGASVSDFEYSLSQLGKEMKLNRENLTKKLYKIISDENETIRIYPIENYNECEENGKESKGAPIVKCKIERNT